MCSCVQGKNSLSVIKGKEYLEKVRKCQSLKKDSAILGQLFRFSLCSRLVSCILFSSMMSCFQFRYSNVLPVTCLSSVFTIPICSSTILSDVSSTWSRNDNA